MTYMDEQRLVELGRVAANGIACEQITTLLLAGFVSNDLQRVLPVFANSWANQLEALKHYLPVLATHTEAAELLRQWRSEANRCRIERNKAIHSATVRFEDGAARQMQFHQGRVREVLLATADLQTIADELGALARSVEKVRVALSETGHWSRINIYEQAERIEGDVG